MNTVGQSSRTPSKHDLLRRIVGREAGVMSTAGFRARRYRMFDLTAGDGTGDGSTGLWVRDCSPGILSHAAAGLGKAGVSTTVLLTERASATFAALMDRLIDELGARGWERVGESDWECGMATLQARQMDSRELAVEFERDDVVFANNDPNTIADWAFPQQFAATCPDMTTTLSTLGCNVGGLKRLDGYERLRWYEHVDQVEATMGSWHDVLLATIDSDPAQWAYCVTTAGVWRGRVERDVRLAFAPRYSVRSAWRSSGAAYQSIQDELFLTKKEREVAS